MKIGDGTPTLNVWNWGAQDLDFPNKFFLPEIQAQIFFKRWNLLESPHGLRGEVAPLMQELEKTLRSMPKLAAVT